MTTTLALHTGTTAAVVPASPTLTLAAAMEIGTVLVKTGFLPEHIKTGPQAAAIILTGQELGMAPMRAVRSLVMVKGKVTESADSQLARFKASGGRAQFTELSDEVAELRLRHPNGDEHVERFTLADAKRAGIASPMYQKFPRAMLRSRAITAGLKSLGWEGGTGIYDPSELTEPAADGEVRETRRSRRAQEAEVVEAEVVEEPLTLEVALGLALPGGSKAWGGKGGQPLSALSLKMLDSVGKWAKAQTEQADGYADAERLYNACVLVMDFKRQEGTPAETLAVEARSAEKPVTGPATPAGAPTEGISLGGDDLDF
jgi:hypothetical protein